MEGPFPAPQRMHPPLPPQPSWEQNPRPTKSSKRVSLAAQAAASGATPRAADKYEDATRASTGVPEVSSCDPQRHAAPRWSAVHRGTEPKDIPEALLHDERLQTSESYYYTSGPDVNSVFFTHAFLEDLAEREVAYKLRRSIDKVASRFVRVRLEGLCESLTQLTNFATEAAVESATKQMSEEGRGGAVTEGVATASVGSIALHPYDSVRAELLPHAVSSVGAGVGGAVSGSSHTVARSACWDRVQRALRGADLTMPLSTYVLAMRADTRGMMNRGLPVRVELSEEEALAWGQNRAHPSSASAAEAEAASSSEPAAASPSLLDTLIGVSWVERQLALRIMQGLSLTVYHQRRCLSDGFLFHYATEQMQCFLQHVEARHRLLHRKAVQSGNWSGHDHSSPPPHTASSTNDKNETNAHSHGSNSSNTRVVRIDEDMLSALVALVDAVEAACHYSAAGLSRLVQAGGVVALLNVVYCPYAPLDLRASILDSISVLLQEVAPFRRLVVSSAPPPLGHVAGVSDGAPGPAEQDEALRVLLHGAFHGYSEAPVNRAGAGGGGATGHLANLRKPVLVGPPPYGLDRASASKFDSAVREWLSQHGLSHVVSGVLGLRDVSAAAGSDAAEPAERTRLQRATKRREKRIQDLLLAIDGRRAELD